jgi:antirestriction protein ArdC
MSTNENTATDKRDVYCTVTSQIIDAIEKGVGNWRMPWHTTGRDAFSPINITSKKAYRGINTLCLWAAADAKGYDSGEWGTYKQWQERKAQVRKGEKSTTVVFWKFANDARETQDGGEDVPACASRLMFARAYSVFNASQVDGYTAKPEPLPAIGERIACAETFFSTTGARLSHGGNRAFYSPAEDRIQMPRFEAFAEKLSYYGTLAHEHIHWTSKAERCDRQLGKRFGDSAYAAEELIAELGAAFVCAQLGLESEPREDHAQYIQSWLKVLKADKRAIFTAASKAQQACDWLVNRAGSLSVAEVAA